MRTLQIIGAVFALAIGVSAASAQDQKSTEINFGVISTETSANLKKAWEPYLEAMSKGTGLSIKGLYASDYAGVIEAMRFGRVHVAWFGNKSAMEAVNRSNGELFAQSVDSVGDPGYWSHLIVHKDSPLQNLEDVLKCDRSIDFGIGDPNSTSGFLVPTAYIFAERNIDPKMCFKNVRNASHEVNAMAVANKQIAVATNNSESLRRLETTAPDARKNIRVIWTSPLIPSDPLVWRKDMSADLKLRIYTWTLSYGRIGTPEELATARKILATLQRAPYKPTNNDQLLPIRILEANKSVLKIKTDDKLSAEEKNAKLAALQAEIKKYRDEAEKADKGLFKQKVNQFLEADKTGDQAELRKLIGDFASAAATAPTN